MTNKYALCLCLFMSIIITGCGGSNDSQQTISKVGETTIVEATVYKDSASTLSLPDGEKLEVPAGALKEDTKITIKKEGKTYKFEPAGLTTNQQLTFKMPVTNDLIQEAAGKHIVGYLYSDQSLAVTTNSGIAPSRISSRPRTPSEATE